MDNKLIQIWMMVSLVEVILFIIIINSRYLQYIKNQRLINYKKTIQLDYNF
jgi:hypothetical protein